MAFLALVFIVVPLVELFLLAKIADGIGVMSTIALCVITGIAGAALARQQGVRTLARVQASMAQGQMPESELVDGMLILFAGAVLLTPGVITDAIGFLLLMPWSRAWLKRGAMAGFKQRVQAHVIRSGASGHRSQGPGSHGPDSTPRSPGHAEPHSGGSSRGAAPKVVDVDFTVKDNRD